MIKAINQLWQSQTFESDNNKESKQESQALYFYYINSKSIYRLHSTSPCNFTWFVSEKV